MDRDIWPITKLLRNSFEGLTLQRNKDTDISFLVLVFVSEAWNLNSHLATIREKPGQSQKQIMELGSKVETANGSTSVMCHL